MYTAAIPPFGSVTAEDVSYDAAPGYPPGTDNVQEALDYLVGATPTIAEMMPTVAGTAFGTQDTGAELNSLGRDVSLTATRSTARYLAAASGTPQDATYTSCIFDSNRSGQDATTNLSDTIASINETSLVGANLTASTIVANTSTLTNVPCGNSILQLNTTNAANATILDSAIVANSSSFDASNCDKTVVLASRLNAASVAMEGGVFVGDASNVALTNLRESVFVASSSGAVVSQSGHQSLYLGNQSLAETIPDRQAWISSYDRFFLRTLRSDAVPTDVVHYDPVTAEITYGPVPTPPAYVLPAKLPTVLGGQYGINSLVNNSEVNGRNSFNNYSLGPVSLSGVTAVGQQLYQASVPGTNNFTNSIFLGRTHQFPGAGTIQNSLIAATIVGNAGISGISESNMIVPRASSLLLNYSGACTGACFVSSNVVTCVSDPTYSCVFSSGGSVNPATSNLVLCENQNGGSVTMAGSGNTLISSSNAAVVYVWPAGVSNCTVIRSGAAAVTPSTNNQLAANHASLLMPNISAVGTAGNTTSPIAFNSATGLISPTLSPLLSRVYRAVGTTTGAGQVIFTPGSGVDPSVAGVSFTATVRNTSTTVAYTCQINAVSATSVTVQVFNSVTVVLASPSMTASGAGIIVEFVMAY